MIYSYVFACLAHKSPFCLGERLGFWYRNMWVVGDEMMPLPSFKGYLNNWVYLMEYLPFQFVFKINFIWCELVVRLYMKPTLRIAINLRDNSHQTKTTPFEDILWILGDWSWYLRCSKTTPFTFVKTVIVCT
jgi:hypothetical protein